MHDDERTSGDGIATGRPRAVRRLPGVTRRSRHTLPRVALVAVVVGVSAFLAGIQVGAAEEGPGPGSRSAQQRPIVARRS